MGLDLVELMLIIEDEFHIEIAGDDPDFPDALDTFGTLASYTAGRLNISGVSDPQEKYKKEILLELQNTVSDSFTAVTDIRQAYPDRIGRIRLWEKMLPHSCRYYEPNRRIYHIGLISGAILYVFSIFLGIAVCDMFRSHWAGPIIPWLIIGFGGIVIIAFSNWLSFQFKDISKQYKTIGDLVDLIAWHRCFDDYVQSPPAETKLPVSQEELEYRLKEMICYYLDVPFEKIQRETKLSSILST
ncbi:MAG: acyl carrier protein [Planctomycetaceae bacterium]|nr:acyl carrier protein [Planctomycetaceae bacterium]